MKSKIVLWVVLVLSTFSTYSADVYVDKDGLINIEGELVKGDAYKLYQILDGSPIRYSNLKNMLVLHSRGGSVLEAQIIADIVKAVGLDTGATGVCVSACFTILMSGEKRYYLQLKSDSKEYSYVGVHVPYININRKQYRDVAGSYNWWQLYGVIRSGGVDKTTALQLLKDMYNTPPSEMFRLNKTRLKALGIHPIIT